MEKQLVKDRLIELLRIHASDIEHAEWVCHTDGQPSPEDGAMINELISSGLLEFDDKLGICTSAKGQAVLEKHDNWDNRYLAEALF